SPALTDRCEAPPRRGLFVPGRTWFKADAEADPAHATDRRRRDDPSPSRARRTVAGAVPSGILAEAPASDPAGDPGLHRAAHARRAGRACPRRRSRKPYRPGKGREAPVGTAPRPLQGE